MLSDAEQRELQYYQYLNKCRTNFPSFITHVKPDYQMTRFHTALAMVLQKFITSKTMNRLMVFCPPRFGKSEQISRMLPAWVFGNNPEFKIIACSYGADLARMMNRDVQRVMDSEEFRQIFPEVRLPSSRVKNITGNWLRNSDMFETVGYGGQYIASGVSGGITGKGGNCILVDDITKNMEEARSAVIRERNWNWYTSTLYTRLEKPGKLCIVNTRWHEDDLCGRLLAEAAENPDADQWTVVNFPALYEDVGNPLDRRTEPGQPLWPERFSLEQLNTIRATVGPTVFNALYQQRPAPAEGGLFKKHNWMFYEDMPKCQTIIQSWDLAFKKTTTSDYVACMVIGKHGKDFYILDYLMERMDINDTLAAIDRMTKRWPRARVKLVEDKANGPAVIDLLKSKINGLIPVTPKDSKEARANAIAPHQETGHVYLPAPDLCGWSHRFMDRAASFPAIAHDDDIDAFTQGMKYLGGTSTDLLRNLIT